MRNRAKGFTLIELMVTVAIIGILAAIAIPSYTANVAKSRRVDGQAALISLSQAMERYYTENYTYKDADTGSEDGDIFPEYAPIDGGIKFYHLTVESADSHSYLIKATAINAQENDGDLTLDQAGTRKWKGDEGWN